MSRELLVARIARRRCDSRGVRLRQPRPRYRRLRSSLPPATRDAWRALFEQPMCSAARATRFRHIPPHKQGVLGRLSPSDREKVGSTLPDA